MNPSIKMEVGIEDCLHIEFEYNKSRWDHVTNGAGCSFRDSPRIDRAGTSRCSLQVSSEGCGDGQDLFPSRQDSDKAHGAGYHSSGICWNRYFEVL
jgi:hypothetical protein